MVRCLWEHRCKDRVGKRLPISQREIQHRQSIRYSSNLIYSLDLDKWALNSTGLNLSSNPRRVKGYYYDWLCMRWKIWQSGVCNETHGSPDFSHPAFKQAFKWMASISVGGCYLNISFYMSCHDPYIRIAVNSSTAGLLHR